MIFVTLSLTLAMILVVWFNTDAFVEYMTLFRLTWIGKIKEYLKVKENGSEQDYLSFLSEYYDSFIVRLITCPICFSVWLGLLISIVFGMLSTSLAVTFAGLCGYHLYNKISKNA